MLQEPQRAYLLWSDHRGSDGGLFAFVYQSRAIAERAMEMAAVNVRIDEVTYLPTQVGDDLA